MKIRIIKISVVLALLTLATTGCEEEDKRSERIAERYAERQAQQSQQMAELQKEVAAGARELVQADAQAREEMTALQRDIQAERTEIGRQRDQLESDRRTIASQRRSDPIIASTITSVGLILASLLPLVLCFFLLHQCTEQDDDGLVGEVLINELTSNRPLFLPHPPETPEIGHDSHLPFPQSSGRSDADPPAAS